MWYSNNMNISDNLWYGYNRINVSKCAERSFKYIIIILSHVFHLLWIPGMGLNIQEMETFVFYVSVIKLLDEFVNSKLVWQKPILSM